MDAPAAAAEDATLDGEILAEVLDVQQGLARLVSH